MNQGKIKKILIWKPTTSQEKLAFSIIQNLQQRGFGKSFIVGGYVRDLLLKRGETGAIDIATEATPQQVVRIFGKKFRVIPTGIKHGTVTIHKGGDDIEITTFRTESRYQDWRRPEKVEYIKDPKEDSKRRDFTINALYFNPLTGEIFDFQGGQRDVKARRLRFVGSAKKRISEDALRLMRAARFVTVLGFNLSVKDQSVIRVLAPFIKKISPERVKQELDKIVLSPNRVAGLKLLFKLRLLFFILPEVDGLARVRQSRNYHSEGNVFIHTLLGLTLIEKNADLSTLYGLLFHDVGKGPTAKPTTKRGRHHISFHGHQELGESLTKKALGRLRFSKKEIDDVAWYVRHHHMPVDLPKMRRAKLMRWCLEPRFGNLLKIFRADSLASVPTDKKGRKLKPSLDLYDFALRVFTKASKQKVLTERFVTGDDVMRLLKISPGPKVGQMLHKIEERQLEGKIKKRSDALKYLKLLK